MSNLPDGVVPSDPNVELFGRIIQNAYAATAGKLSSADLSTPSRRTALLAEIENVVNESDDAVKAWVQVNIGGFYEMGLWESAKDLNERGTVVRYDQSFTKFHRQALEAIANTTYNDIAEGMRGLNRTAERLVSQSTTQNIINQIGRGQITGESNRDLVKLIKNEFKSSGITGLRDRSGREWGLDRYGDMLVRTKLTQAHNTGVVNRMLESGNDLVVVSSHGGSCKICAPWEGKVLSISGRNKSYISLDMAMKGGLFHPNCRHTITPYYDKYLDASVAWDAEKRRYRPYQSIRSDIIARNKKRIEDALKKTTFAEASKKIVEMMAPRVVTFAEKKIELSPFEAHLADKRNLVISDTPITGKGSRTVLGQYDSGKNTIIWGKSLVKDGIDPTVTLYHEFGHFIDAQYRDYQERKFYGIKGGVVGHHVIAVPNFLTRDYKIQTLLSDYELTILHNRLTRDKDYKNLTPEQSKSLVYGLPMDGKRLVPSYRKYVRSGSELFADAYAQFRVDPVKFAKEMPKLYEFFMQLSTIVL